MERSKGVGGSCSNTFQKQRIVGDRKASFSAYLRPEDGHAGDDTTEISIFEAQKYFNETIIDAQKVSNHNNNNNAAIINRAISRPLANNVDNMEQLSRFSWASSSVHDEYASINMSRNNLRARSFHAAATPTASSEASWNSQTGLLSHPRGTVAVSLRSPTHSHHHHQHHAHDHDHDQKKSRRMTPSLQQPRVRWFSFPRRCPCSGKKAVRVEEKISSSPLQPVNSLAVAAAPCLLQSSSSSNDNVSRSISMDLRNQTLKSKSVVSARDEQHVMWDQEHGRRWEGQVTVKMPPRNPHNRLFTTAGVVLDKDSSSSNLPQMQHANGFSFPILKLNGGSRGTSSAMLKLQQPALVKNGLNTAATLKQEPTLGWDSLESHERQSSTTISISIHNPAAAATTTCDHLSNGGFTFPASPKSRVIISNDDDLGSDASSDLFEIESFSASTQATATANSYPPMVYQYNNYRRDSMEDDAPSFNAIRGLYRRRSSLDIEPMTPSSAGEYCYEPSEASIDWSVTTAEGLDRPSALSEADYHQDDELEKISKRRSLSSSGGGGGNYGLLSCRSEKAVSVGPNPVRLVGDEVMRHVGSRPPLPHKPRSHSPHLSIPFAT